MSLIPFGFWAASGGGAAGAFDLLETTTLTTSASSVTFSGLGAYSDYKHLQLRFVMQNDLNGSARDFHFNLNGDTGSNYSSHSLQGNGTSVSSTSSTTATKIMGIFTPDANAGNANAFGVGIMDILDFSNSSKNTTIRMLQGSPVSDYPRIGLVSGLYINTAAITSFLIRNDGNQPIITGSRFSLYGVK